MSITIRKAKPDDVDWLMDELKKFSEFFGSKQSLYGDEAYVRPGLLALIEKHVFFIAEKDSVGNVGFIAGVDTPHMFNPKIRVLCETFWWVAKEYRNSRAGILLLNAFVSWGNQNVNWINFALEDKSPVNPKALLKRGFRMCETNFVKEL